MASIKDYKLSETMITLPDTLFERIKKNYPEFLFGISIGISICLLLTIIPLNPIVFLCLVNLIISAMLFLRITIPMKENVETKLELKMVKKRHGCPECGSSGRHKKGCSRSKEKK